MTIAVCLFLPHAKTCQGGVQTPLESGTWVVIAPIVLIGLLPVLWCALPKIRNGTPEILLALTMLAMGMFVLTIPIAIWLVWGYSKKSFRGEVLAAMCSAALLMMWLLLFPITMVFDKWLPAAELTWGAGCVELFGLLVWTSAAAARPMNVDEESSLHVNHAEQLFEISV